MFDQKAITAKYDDIKQWGQKHTPQQIVQDAVRSNIGYIAYTYNEPTVQFEYALDTMREAKKVGIKNVWVTNGFTSQVVRNAIMPYLDAANVDIKSSEDLFYTRYCGGKRE